MNRYTIFIVCLALGLAPNAFAQGAGTHAGPRSGVVETGCGRGADSSTQAGCPKQPTAGNICGFGCGDNGPDAMGLHIGHETASRGLDQPDSKAVNTDRRKTRR